MGRPKGSKITTEQFVQRSIAKHGDRYDYSLVRYVRADDKVEIICTEHGPFLQRAVNHTSGHGCPRCSGVLMTTEFIDRSVAIHGDKYDYSLVKYKGINSKVDIVCPRHGVFHQMAVSHLNGDGCYHCGREKCRMTQSDFIERCSIAHNNKYDYSLTVYNGMRNGKIVIICPLHGKFTQNPYNHLRGGGCMKCSQNHNRCDSDHIIKKFTDKYGDRYDYSKVAYVSLDKDVIVTCKIHGSFLVTPENHIHSHHCPTCEKIEKDGVIASYLFKAMSVHNNYYSYAVNQSMTSIKDKMEITCPVHGVFYQSWYNHVSLGCGCKKCAHEDNDYHKYTWAPHCVKIGGTPVLYVLLLYNSDESFYKVGITMVSLADRFQAYKRVYTFSILHLFTGDPYDVASSERALKKELSNFRYAPNKKFGGATECFKYIPSTTLNDISIKYNLNGITQTV